MLLVAPPFMRSSIRYVGSLGGSNGNGNVSQFIHAVSAGAPVGDLVVVCASGRNPDDAVPTCTDARGNVYTRVVGAKVSGRSAAIFVSKLTTALQAGDNITITWATTTQGSNLIEAFRLTGNYSGVLASASGSGSGSNHSLTVNSARGFVCMICSVNNNSETFTPPGGYTEDRDVNAISSSLTVLHRTAIKQDQGNEAIALTSSGTSFGIRVAASIW